MDSAGARLTPSAEPRGLQAVSIPGIFLGETGLGTTGKKALAETIFLMYYYMGAKGS